MELTEMTVQDLRKLGAQHKIKDYHTLKRTELVREIRKATTKPVTKLDAIDALKEAHKMLDVIIQQQQAKKQGYTSVMGAREKVRMIINAIEKLSL